MSEQTTALQLKLKWRTKDLLNLIGAVKAVNNDKINLNFTEEGLKVNTYRQGDSYMISAKFPKESFPEYNCSGLNQAIDIMELKNIAKRLEKFEVIDVYLNDSSRIVFEAGGKKFSNRIEESRDMGRDLPHLNTTASIETSLSELSELLNDAKIGEEGKYDSSRTKFTVKDGNLSVSRVTTATDFDRAIPNGEVWKISGSAEAMYAIDTLKSLATSVSKASKVRLDFGDNLPVMISFDEGQIRAFLAPIVGE